MRLVAAVVGAIIAAALGAVFWNAIAADASTGALVLLGVFDASVGAFIGWQLAGSRIEP